MRKDPQRWEYTNFWNALAPDSDNGSWQNVYIALEAIKNYFS